MINRHKYTGKFILASFLICICSFSSCTYDYFEDETNYILYVPKVDVNKRTDTYKLDEVKYFIYDNSSLCKHVYSCSPFADNPRAKVGDFHQKLFPGRHNVFCFSNISRLNFANTESYESSSFSLTQSEDGYFQEPVGVLLDTKNPFIQFPGPVVVDTAWMEHKYVGRICLAFKNLTNIDSRLTFNNIKSIQIIATGIGTIQYLSQISDDANTRSTTTGANDMMKLSATLYENPYQGFDFGFENYYFPSPGNAQKNTTPDQPIRLAVSFIDGNNNVIQPLNIDIVDRLNGNVPIILHMNETLLVQVDGSLVTIIKLDNPEDWNSVIDPGGNTTPGGGGIEM